jgi:hypothetical protein
VDGERIEVTFDFGEGPQTFADQGLTADTVLALAAAGIGAPRIADATAWLEDEAGTYTGLAFDEVYVGPVAKLLVVADATGLDPRDLGGLDLVATLTEREQSSGRYTDASEWGDFSSGISQSLAVLGLHRTACEDEEPGSIRFDAADSGDRDRATPQAVLGLTEAGLADVTAAGASADVPAFDCSEPAPVSEPEPEAGDDTTSENAAATADAVAADAASEDPAEPQEGTEAAPGEMPRTGAGTVLLGLLGTSLLAGGLTTLRRFPSAT